MSGRTSTTKRKRNNKLSNVWALLLIVLTVPFLFNLAYFMIQKVKLEITKKDLTEQIEQQTAQQQQYQQEINRIGTAEYYEYLARKYLNYIYPDENILIVTNPDNTDGN